MCALGAGIVNRRTQSRYRCSQRRVIEFAVWPRFGSVWADLHEISHEGIDVVCPFELDPGTSLLFRPDPHGNNALAKVVCVTRVGDSGWQIRCLVPLPEMFAYLAA